jgi:hypothetical protein
VTIKQTVDEVQVAWTTAPGTNGEFAGQMGFRAGRKSCGLFVPRMNPFDVTAPANRVSYSIEAVAHNTVDSTHAGRMKNIGNKISDSLGFHVLTPDKRHVRASHRDHKSVVQSNY